MDVGAEHEVNGPLALVDKREAAPGVLLIGLDAALEDPVLNHQHVGKVSGLLTEAQVCRAIVKSNEVAQLKRD